MLSTDTQHQLMADLIARSGVLNRRKPRILVIPPDHSRLYSGAGELTQLLWKLLAPTRPHIRILPALGTHLPMTSDQLRRMFGTEIPLEHFLPHDFRNGVERVGELSAENVFELTGGLLDISIPVLISRHLLDRWDWIISVGQVVPHEVAGMAGYTKNIMIGVGGAEFINPSHYLGALFGIENTLGRVDTPVRRLLNHAARRFLGDLPISYLMTVMDPPRPDNHSAMRQLFCSDLGHTGEAAFHQAAACANEANFTVLDRPARKIIAWLDPEEFTSTWLGNKAVYRTRLAMADGGELIVLAPGLSRFGEDSQIDRLIRKYGYRTTPETRAAVEQDPELQANLSAPAHLMHGSSEGRFSIRYCPGPLMAREELEQVGYLSGDLGEYMQQYNPSLMQDGWNRLGDEDLYFVRYPALGLWSARPL